MPVIENAPLARALHGGVELGAEIPQVHYQAVAEVIGHVMRLTPPAAGCAIRVRLVRIGGASRNCSFTPLP